MWFSNLKAERLYRRGTVLLAAGLLVTGMAACGSGKESGTSNGKVNTKTEQSAQKSKNGTSSIPKNMSGVNPGQTSQPKTGAAPGQTPRADRRKYPEEYERSKPWTDQSAKDRGKQ